MITQQLRGHAEFDHIKCPDCNKWHFIPNQSIKRMTKERAEELNEILKDEEQSVAGWARPTGINPHIKGHKKVTGKTW